MQAAVAWGVIEKPRSRRAFGAPHPPPHAPPGGWNLRQILINTVQHIPEPLCIFQPSSRECVMNHPFNPRHIACIAAALLLAPLAVAAQDEPGFYVGVYGGPSAMASTSFSESRATGAAVGGKVTFGSGIGFGAVVGQRYGNGWAAELALDERGNFLKRVGGIEVDGNIFSTVVFLNGYYRFPAWGAVRPFVGAGLGYVTVMDIDVERDGAEQEYSRQGGLAVQAIAGGEFSLSSRWSLSGDLRWSRMESGAFKATTAGNTLSGKPKYQPVSLNVGVSYRF
jgi:opacity protein-like surface antigen